MAMPAIAVSLPTESESTSIAAEKIVFSLSIHAVPKELQACSEGSPINKTNK